MVSINKIVRKLDNIQQQSKPISFLVAVVKKYSDDQASNLAALITYYGFVSLFPLLLVFFTLLRFLTGHNLILRQKIINSTIHYFPVIGQQLQSNIRTLHYRGLTLIVEILIIVYGASGIANSFQNASNKLWDVPKENRPAFPKNLLRSFGIIVVGGVGLITTTTFLSYVTGIGHGNDLLKAVLLLASLVLNFLVVICLFRLATAKAIKTKDLLLGAALTTIFWQILQVFGSFLVLHEFKQASAVYGIFAIVLGLLFWIYIQAEVTLYAIVIDVVRIKKLWPRRLV